jgi:dolichol-phosphate mannosyltransferase
MLFGIAGLMSLVWVVWKWMQGGTVQGWASLAALTLIMGSVQLLVLGVFGEYLGRMYMEAKRRPLFIISEVRRHSVSLDAIPGGTEGAIEPELREGIHVAG